MSAAQSEAAQLCIKVDAGNASQQDLDRIREQKKNVYLVRRASIPSSSIGFYYKVSCCASSVQALIVVFLAAADQETDPKERVKFENAANANVAYFKELGATAENGENPCDYV